MKKEKTYSFMTIEVKRGTYFRLLELCIARKKTLDEMVEEILMKALALAKEEKKHGKTKKG